MMRRPSRTTFAAGLALTAALQLAGCSSTKPAIPADNLWTEANGQFDDGAYDYAIQKYKQLLDQYPFDPNAEAAALKIAQAHYMGEKYQEAIAAYGDFQRMHPTSENLPSVQYHIGMSYLAQATTSDRDQEPLRQALTYFANLVDRYPTSPWTEKARLRQRECRESLAKHHRDIAAWYIRHNNIKAAESRFARLLTDYADTDAAAESLDLFATEYGRRDDAESASLVRATLLRHHPNGPLAERARAAGTAVPSDDPLPQLLSRIAGLSSRPDRQKAPATVSSYPTQPPSN
jgi:outer membrane protein assembly factor BamD